MNVNFFQVEPWYGTKYVTEKIPSDKIEKWSKPLLNEKFQIPEKNEFIPTEFDLAPRDTDDTEVGPSIIKETPLFRYVDKYNICILTGFKIVEQESFLLW